MKKNRRLLVIGIALGVAATLSVAGYLNRSFDQATGVFSSLKYYDETGDIGGMEIHILYGRGTYWVVHQRALGEVGMPTLVEANISDDHSIKFIVMDFQDKPITYTGKITKNSLTLLEKSDRGEDVHILPRIKRWWF
jgi:hypothetical protein